MVRRRLAGAVPLSRVDADAYLVRIGLTGPVVPSPTALRALHRAHLLSVPFENLSIHLGEPVVLDLDALFDKVVTRRRGGFCYELNGVFAALLRALGFDVTMVSAGVMGDAGTYGPEFDHMALLVSVGERWLVDVGFGDSFLEPLRLDEPGEQVDPAGVFRIVTEAAAYRVVLRRNEAGQMRPLYRFTGHPHDLVEYSEMCLYHQTSPDSPFTSKRLVTLATEDGRVTLTGTRFVVTRAGVREERELQDEEEYTHVLRDTFGVA